MPTGTVKWFNTAKGYGFIAPEGGGNDYICSHISCRTIWSYGPRRQSKSEF